MNLFAVYPTPESLTGTTYAPTLAMARPMAEALASEGKTVTIARVQVGTLTKGLLINVLNHTGWMQQQKDIEVYIPILPETGPAVPPFAWEVRKLK